MEETPSTDDFDLETLISTVVPANGSLLDLLRPAPSGDYRAHIQQMRLFLVLLREPLFLTRIRDEIDTKIVQNGGKLDDADIMRELARKDGTRRFAKLAQEHARTLNEQPSLLSGASFEACLTQYQALLGHVERLWAEACRCYMTSSYLLAAFISILVIEEVSKLCRLPYDLMFYDVPRAASADGGVHKSHRRKHFVGVISGALINTRLDRVLGKDVIRKILHQAESDELEKIRQSCLYIDLRGDRAVTPAEVIHSDQARTLTVLSGEIMAEVLGISRGSSNACLTM